MLNERICWPETLLGSLGCLIQVGARCLPDDKNVDIVRRVARDAFIAGCPRAVDRHGDRVFGEAVLDVRVEDPFMGS